MLVLIAAALATPPGTYAPPPVEVDPFAWSAESEPIIAGQPGTVNLRLVVPPPHFVYADALSLDVADGAGFEVGTWTLPPSEFLVDPTDPGVSRPMYPRDTWIPVPVTAPDTPGLRTLALDVRHQGCRPGLCFPPKTTRVEVLVAVRSPE